MTANKLNAKSHFKRSSKQTSLPLSISNSMGEAGQYGVRIGKLGKPSLICNLGRDTTAPNRLKIKSHSGRSGSDVKPILRWHRETGFGAYRPWSPCTKHTRQHAASQSTNRLRCNDVTAQKDTKILRDNGGRFRVVLKELCYGKAETLGDAEAAAKRVAV